MGAKRLAFTLIELMTCIAVMLVVMALLLPAVARSKREGYKADATAKLHNVGAALLMYQDHSEGWPLYTLDPLFDAGYIRDPNYLLMRAVDPYPQGYAKARHECQTSLKEDRLDVPLRRTSFDDIFRFDGWGKKVTQVHLAALMQHDPNPGLVAIRVFGEDVKRSSSCNCANVRLMGSTIRVRMDGSVKRGHYHDVNPKTGRYWYCHEAVFTDLPPKDVCFSWVEPAPNPPDGGCR